MLKSLVTKVVGTRFQRELKRIQPLVDAIHRHEERLKGVPDGDVQRQTERFRELIAERIGALAADVERLKQADRKSTRLNSSHGYISYAVFCLKKKNHTNPPLATPHR